MTTAAEVQRELNGVIRDLAELKLEATQNVGLLATAIRQTRLNLAAIEQQASVRRIAGPTQLIGWDPRQGAFGKDDFTSSLLDRLKAAATSGAGGPAAQQTSVILRDALAAFDAVYLTAIQQAVLAMGGGAAAYDVRLVRPGAKTFQIDDMAGGPAKLWIAGDEVQILNNSLAIVYNGDGTVSTVTRSGAQGAATTTVTWSAGHIVTVVTVRGGKTVTLTPTYTGEQITTLARAVA